MAISFKEAPWYIQALLFVALALVLLVAGEYTPGLPVSTARTELQTLRTRASKVNQEVSALQVYERRYTEFTQEMNALSKQLDTLKAIVPEGKEVDEFMRLLQGAAAGSGVQVRKLSAQAVVTREYHYEMPFAIEVDGPYFAIEDFFSRLSRLSRIINVGDLSFESVNGEKQTKYPVRPNTSVTGSCVVTTFFTAPAEGESVGTTTTQASAAVPAPPQGKLERVQ